MTKGEVTGGGRNSDEIPTSTPSTSNFVVVWCLDAWHVIFDLVAERLKKESRVGEGSSSSKVTSFELRMFDPRKGPLAAQVSDAKVLVPTTGEVPAEAIDAATDLVLITQPASGLDNVDLAAAKRRGVPVCSAPGVNAASVAEASVMSLLMLARRYREVEVSFKEKRIGSPIGTELRGKRLGLVGGRGEIGRRVGKIAEAIGMQIFSVNSTSTQGEWDELLALSDAISLHCPLSAATRHLIDEKKLNKMKSGVLLVNYARGAIVDEAALLRALESGKVGAAALDVFEVEPADPSSPLASHPRVLATPHIGVATREVGEAYAELLVSNIVAASEGRLGDLRWRKDL